MKYCTCEKCGREAEVDIRMVYLTSPVKYNYHCKHCENIGKVYEASTYTSSKEDADTLLKQIENLSNQLEECKKRIEELEKTRQVIYIPYKQEYCDDGVSLYHDYSFENL